MSAESTVVSLSKEKIIATIDQIEALVGLLRSALVGLPADHEVRAVLRTWPPTAPKLPQINGCGPTPPDDDGDGDTGSGEGDSGGDGTIDAGVDAGVRGRGPRR